MDGICGLSNWQWVFILEGILTIAVGIAAFFLILDFPEDATWLTGEEQRFIVARAGGHELSEVITSRDLLVFFKKLRNVLGGIMYLSKCFTCHQDAYNGS